MGAGGIHGITYLTEGTDDRRFERAVHARLKINVSAFISLSAGATPLIIFEGTMNVMTYTNLFQAHFVPYFVQQRANGVEPLIVIDNGGYHNNVRQVCPGWSFVKWPPNSPDLNPIEDAWRALKAKLATRYAEIRNRDDLVRVAGECWAEVSTPQCIARMYERMEERVLRSLAQGGGNLYPQR